MSGADVVRVHHRVCGCGFQVSALDRERVKAAMCDHIEYVHNEARLQSSAEDATLK